MGRAAAADGGSAPRGPFAVDRDRALAELELAWSEGGYHGFTAAGATCCAVIPAGLIPGDGTRTTLGAWDLTDLMDQLDAIYPDSSQVI